MKYIIIAIVFLLVLTKIGLTQKTNTFIISASNLDSVEFKITYYNTKINTPKIDKNKISDFKYEYNLRRHKNYKISIKNLKNNKVKYIYINTGKLIDDLAPIRFTADFNTTASLHIRYNKKLKIYEYLVLN